MIKHTAKLLCAVSLLSPIAAHAADMAVKAAPPMPAAAAVYNWTGLYVGVPVIIGAGGVERVVEIDLNKAEKAMFDKSVSAVRGLIDEMRKIQRGVTK